MSKGKHIRPNSEYLAEIKRLRTDGYSWSALGRHFNKDRTTIMYIWKRWVGKPSKTTRHHIRTVQQVHKLLASWDGNQHLCCNSFLPKIHLDGCLNMSGNWSHNNNFSDTKAVQKSKYDHILDDKKNVGKTYQQYLLKRL